LNTEYKQFDADVKFGFVKENTSAHSECIAGMILKGIKKPVECPHFGTLCNPQNPLGAPMVSSEGACAAYYNYSR